MLYIRFLGTCLITGMSVLVESKLHANPSLKPSPISYSIVTLNAVSLFELQVAGLLKPE
jgi:hypothetical protein